MYLETLVGAKIKALDKRRGRSSVLMAARGLYLHREPEKRRGGAQ
jgi:hypothetical protein